MLYRALAAAAALVRATGRLSSPSRTAWIAEGRPGGGQAGTLGQPARRAIPVRMTIPTKPVTNCLNMGEALPCGSRQPGLRFGGARGFSMWTNVNYEPIPTDAAPCSNWCNA